MPVRDVSMEKQIIINEVEELAKESRIDMPVDEDVAELLASTYHGSSGRRLVRWDTGSTGRRRS